MSKKLDSHDTDDARILEPDFSLKRKIGEDIDVSRIFTPERIAEAQQAIDDKKEEFLEWASKDLAALDEAYRDFTAAPVAAFFELDHMRRLSFSLKCQAGTFGFGLASEIARLLHQYLMQHSEFTENHLLVTRKHIEALRAVLVGKIQGNGGQTGKELLAHLKMLTDKFA